MAGRGPQEQAETMAGPDRVEQSRQASVRAKVEHPFLIVKRNFGFTKTRYRGISKNLNHLHVLFAWRELVDARACRRSHRGGGVALACPKPPERAREGR